MDLTKLEQILVGQRDCLAAWMAESTFRRAEEAKRIVVVFCLSVVCCWMDVAAVETVAPDRTTVTNYPACVNLVSPDPPHMAATVRKVEEADKTLKGLLHVLEKDGFASVKEADYVGLSFYEERSLKAWENPHFCPLTFAFRGIYVTTGNGWRRKDMNGKVEHLAFDAVWRPEDRRSGVSVREEKPRIARDVAKVRAYLRDAAENPEEAEFCFEAEEEDVFALAFALHLQQCGREQDAQSIYEALCRRPVAAEAAFANLRQRVKLGKRQKGGK